MFGYSRTPSVDREEYTPSSFDALSYSHSHPPNAAPAEHNGAKAEAIDYGNASGSPIVKEENGDAKLEDAYVSRSASVELKHEHDALKSRPSATPPVSTKSKGKNSPSPVQLIGHLPQAEEEAMQSFTEIKDNHYQYGIDEPSNACGHDSDCINRLTQVECMPDDCRCRSYCQNQRFQRKEYAAIEIVKTEMKGFGLRASEDLPRDTFIYEYVGDVVSQPSFLKRMRQYAEEGIRHFYFMMLQKDEFIDATKRGGIGRFANHSCNPNCYVAKWTVGRHVRMGIFAHRNIKQNEELTFNYNVDRYGHDAQPCYCGEPNCVGFIGGKTQTDIAAMDDLYLDALGITEEVEQLGLKGSKKKKSKKLDEDFIPTLKPLVEKDVPKVVQAMRQTQSRKVMFKLLTRIKITEDLAALRQIMRLRGFSVMTNVLEDYSSDLEITTLAMECMMTWPLIQRNKVEDSKINVPVELCAQSENEGLLLEQWNALEYAYRIPKRLKGDGEDDCTEPIVHLGDDEDPRPLKRSRKEDLIPEVKLDIKPLGLPPSRGKREERRSETRISSSNDLLLILWSSNGKRISRRLLRSGRSASAASVAAQTDALENGASTSSRKKSSKHRKQSKEEKEANKDKRLLKLVGAVVVKCMSKYQKRMNHDVFKKHAKELTHTIAEKEKKSTSYKEGRLDALSDEKVTKIKKFAKEYIAKVLRKLEKSQRRPPDVDQGPTSVASTSTPDAHDAEDEFMPDVADIMDLDHNDENVEKGEHDAPGSWTPEDQSATCYCKGHEHHLADPILKAQRYGLIKYRSEGCPEIAC
ncbi:Histone-lysine N-methyltransferase, H3 lysine-36 specific [Grifola frondosa]|uniref:Histone-lysine N-methyltransferase, H3 lysine-36 specific n=1 Tax=Grifola frondosa TaxID=5627 RepID=A0A1C7MEC2_GRIFR|nr:Histone-lysine N-methyltransferase, H3 lysine-36 specific [Grifola frondosa]